MSFLNLSCFEHVNACSHVPPLCRLPINRGATVVLVSVSWARALELGSASKMRQVAVVGMSTIEEGTHTALVMQSGTPVPLRHYMRVWAMLALARGRVTQRMCGYWYRKHGCCALGTAIPHPWDAHSDPLWLQVEWSF